jgi:thymidylate synthase
MHTYLDLLEHVLEYGESCDDRTGVGTLSTFGLQFRHHMADGFPLLTTKHVLFRWVAEELFWFLSGSTNEQDLRDKGVDIWKEWATADECARFGRDEGDLGPIYGALWRRFDIGAGSCDQIKTICDQMQYSPYSRRIVCSGWHPYHATRVSLPPCHTLFQLKVHSNIELSLHLYARSIDIFLGLPFNIASYGLLLEMLGHVTGMKTRELVISFGDLHLYKNHKEQAELQLTREPHKLPRLEIASPTTGNAFEDLIAIRYPHVFLLDYEHHPKIQADVAV